MFLPKFDPQKPSGVYGEMTPHGQKTYVGQDGALFDGRTYEFVRYVDGPPSQPEPVPQTVSCNRCGKLYHLGRTDKTRELAMKRMREHLKKEHGVEVQ